MIFLKHFFATVDLNATRTSFRLRKNEGVEDFLYTNVNFLIRESCDEEKAGSILSHLFGGAKSIYEASCIDKWSLNGNRGNFRDLCYWTVK